MEKSIEVGAIIGFLIGWCWLWYTLVPHMF